MTATFTRSINQTFHVVSCYTCGIAFGIGGELYRRVVIDAKGSVYCPSCGKLTCWRESDADIEIKRMGKKLANAERRAATALRQVEYQQDRREKAEESLSATKGVVTRIKNRVGKGICPCCNRHFVNLAKHMAGQHPDYTDD